MKDGSEGNELRTSENDYFRLLCLYVCTCTVFSSYPQKTYTILYARTLPPIRAQVA